MAAEMMGQARGADVLACLDWMVQGQAAASDILKGAHAMTDVTGFGLAGHLRGICEASEVGARITRSTIPVMAGAEELSTAGIRSSLFDDNRQGAGPIEGPTCGLFYDPQTAGGLLAAVGAQEADKCLDRLVAAGYRAAIIGEITENRTITIV